MEDKVAKDEQFEDEEEEMNLEKSKRPSANEAHLV